MNKIKIGQMLNEHNLNMEDFLKWIKEKGEINTPDGIPTIPRYELDRYIRMNTDDEEDEEECDI